MIWNKYEETNKYLKSWYKIYNETEAARLELCMMKTNEHKTSCNYVGYF